MCYVPGQPIQVKDIIFFKPLNAATKPPEDILKSYSPVLLSLFTVTGNRLETTNRRRFLSFFETVLSGIFFLKRKYTEREKRKKDVIWVFMGTFFFFARFPQQNSPSRGVFAANEFSFFALTRWLRIFCFSDRDPMSLIDKRSSCNPCSGVLDAIFTSKHPFGSLLIYFLYEKKNAGYFPVETKKAYPTWDLSFLVRFKILITVPHRLYLAPKWPETLSLCAHTKKKANLIKSLGIRGSQIFSLTFPKIKSFIVWKYPMCVTQKYCSDNYLLLVARPVQDIRTLRYLLCFLDVVAWNNSVIKIW